MDQDKIEMPTLHTNLSKITHGWSKMLGLSKLGMFLYDLQQKVMFDTHQIVGKYVLQGWQKINIENFPFESPHFSIAKEHFFFLFIIAQNDPKLVHLESTLHKLPICIKNKQNGVHELHTNQVCKICTSKLKRKKEKKNKKKRAKTQNKTNKILDPMHMLTDSLCFGVDAHGM